MADAKLDGFKIPEDYKPTSTENPAVTNIISKENLTKVPTSPIPTGDFHKQQSTPLPTSGSNSPYLGL